MICQNFENHSGMPTLSDVRHHWEIKVTRNVVVPVVVVVVHVVAD